MKKLLRYLLYTVLIMVLFLGVFAVVVAYSNALVTQFPDQQPAEIFRAERTVTPPPLGDSLKVMTYNVKFGAARIDFYFDCYGDRVSMTQEESTRNIRALAAFIRKVNPDVLLLQEVDIESDRVGGVNQLQQLLDLTAMNYAAYASQWHVQYVPDGANGEYTGFVNSGNAVLSRWPIRQATRHALPLMDSQAALTRFFYPRRNILEAQIDLPGRAPVVAYNTHLTAYDKDGTRKKQLDIIQDRLAKETRAFVFGGDLNTLPPGTRKAKNFDDSVCKEDDFTMDDYTAELDWLTPFYKAYREVIPLKQYQADEKKYYSHTVNGRGYWNRRLDYLFTNRSWADSSGTVHQEGTMPLSDHAPVSGMWVLGQ